MSRREIFSWMVKSFLITILLEVMTGMFVNYNIATRIGTGLLWFWILLLFFADIHWILKKEFVKYHIISAITMTSFIILILFLCLVLWGKSINLRPVYLIFLKIGRAHV